jgi:hypothetical protein
MSSIVQVPPFRLLPPVRSSTVLPWFYHPPTKLIRYGCRLDSITLLSFRRYSSLPHTSNIDSQLNNCKKQGYVLSSNSWLHHGPTVPCNSIAKGFLSLSLYFSNRFPTPPYVYQFYRLHWFLMKQASSRQRHCSTF